MTNHSLTDRLTRTPNRLTRTRVYPSIPPELNHPHPTRSHPTGVRILTRSQLGAMDLRSLSDARLAQYASAFPGRHIRVGKERDRRGL